MARKKPHPDQQSLGNFFKLGVPCKFCKGMCVSIDARSEYCCHCKIRMDKELHCNVCNGRKKKWPDYDEIVENVVRVFGTTDLQEVTDKLYSQDIQMPSELIEKGLKEYEFANRTSKKQNRKDLRIRGKTRTVKTNGSKRRPRQTRLY